MSKSPHPRDMVDSPQLSSAPPAAAGDETTAAAQAIAPQRRQPKRSRGIQPAFKTLIGLTLLTAVLLIPFALSEVYLDVLRSRSFDLHQFIRGELYKQGTGYAALIFVLIELLLTLRKRGRGWFARIKLPGSMMFWRSTHIFLGVALLGMVLIHTLGANGLNFNAVFLWVFFATTLTALVGVVAETGILESTRSYFGKLPGSSNVLTKGPLIRGLRAIWLTSHIFFVCVFAVMLVFHIALAYYYQ